MIRKKLKLKKGYGFNSYWPLQESLFIRESRVSLKPAKLAMRAFSRNFPDGTELLEKGGVSSMTLRDLAPLSEEAHTIPPREQQARLHVLYGWAGKKDPATFWQEDVGEPWADITEKFMKKPRQLRSVVESVVSPEDSPEQKLRKLYDAVQKIRNLSYEEYYTNKERSSLPVASSWSFFQFPRTELEPLETMRSR